MENQNIYKVFVFIICMILPTILISSAIRHTREENQNVIKQKIGIMSLILSSFANIFGIGIGIFLLYFSLNIIKATIINNQNYKLDIILILIGIPILLGSSAIILTSVCNSKHLYFELSRKVYFEKETGKIIVRKNNFENSINLNSSNIKIIQYRTPVHKFSTYGKTEIFDGENIVVISDSLDITPELREKISNNTNKEIIEKKLTWI